MKKVYSLLCVSLFFLIAVTVSAEEMPLSEATSACIECHAMVHPGIVEDWQKSRHAKITPKTAMGVEGLARKVSSKDIADNLKETVVGCAECHTQRPGAHADTFEHNGYDIHIAVSPKDCATCHTEETSQYGKNIMAHAYDNLAENELYQKLQLSIIGTKKRVEGQITYTPANDSTKAEACYYCHGTRLKVVGKETRDTELAGELEFPIIEGWPNQGVGRINLDGSLGSCSSCHARHTFSIEMARKPQACKECHVGPDVPAFKVYAASKHGNIYSTMNKSWDFNAVPWTIGKDFTAPTCATCHMSLLANGDGEAVSPRSHQMSDRLPWRLFGLVYAHPHPQAPDTTIIRNKEGQPLPTSLDGKVADDYLIDEKERNTRRQAMQAACLSCHGTSWVNGHWKRLENTIERTNADVLIATNIIEEVWQDGFADGKSSPFDEGIEKKWTDIWQFYANTIRFASAMGGGGDYEVYADGNYHLTKSLLEMNDWLNHQRMSSSKDKK